MTFGLAIFGLGRIGKIHLDILSKCRQISVKYVVEKDEFINSAKKWLDEELYDYNYYEKISNPANFQLIKSSDADKVYNDKNVQAVYICTPTDLHEEIVIKSLEHEKAIFCEKPLAMTLKSTIKCYQMAYQKNLPLLVAFNRRFDPQLVEIQRKISNNEMGQIHQIRTVARDNPVPSYDYLRISGGIFHDCAVHDMDLCRFIAKSTNKEVKSIYVTAHAYDQEIAKMNDVDTVNIVLEFTDNLHCSIDLSRHGVYGYDQRCEVFAEKGLLSSENVRDSWIQQSKSRNNPDGKFCSNSGTVIAPVQYTFRQRYDASYTEELYHFLELLNNKSEARNKMRVQHSDTILASLLADACEKAHHEKKRVDFGEFVMEETLIKLGKSYTIEQIKNSFGDLHQV